MKIWKILNIKEKQTFKLHLIYSIIEGIILGVFSYNEFVFLRSLNGTNYQLSLLFTFSWGVFLFSIFFNEFLRRIQNKAKLLRIVAIFTRIPLLFLILFPTHLQEIVSADYYHFIFLGMFFIYYLSNPIVFPTINVLLKSNYEHNNFGKLYSFATLSNKIVMIITTFIFGLLLDNYSRYAFVYIYPLMSILGVISIFLLTKIDFALSSQVEIKTSIFSSITNSVKNSFSILKGNKPYRDFEWGFVFYGFAFMVAINVITIFLEDSLHLNHVSYGFYKNIYYNVLSLMMLPFFGKLIGKIDPRVFAIITFSALLLHYLFLAITINFPAHFSFMGIEFYYMLLVSFFFYSVFAATMGLLWSIGSAYFCKKEEAADYQSIHLSLTGVRALVAPAIGILFYNMFGFTGTFSIAILSLAIGISILYLSLKKYTKE